MGDGEAHIMVFSEWWEQEDKNESQRIEYFRKWHAPPRWMDWMADYIWDLEIYYEGKDIDYDPYFEKLEELGFEGVADYEKDLNDEKWLKMEGF